MTDLLYLSDSYLQLFTAVVTAVDEENRAVLLNQTTFYPGGGGQLYDTGTLSGGGLSWPVKRTRKEGAGVWHILEGEESLPPVDTTIQGALNWERRYQTMRTHTAMHILCGVIFRDYGASVTGGNMEPLKGRMDFEFESLTRDLVTVIEEAVNKEVEAGREVYTAILPREEAFKIPDLIRTRINILPPGIREVRVVEIAGLDLQADGGTHVCNTTEVGTMRIADYKSKGKINKRIYVELD